MQNQGFCFLCGTFVDEENKHERAQKFEWNGYTVSRERNENTDGDEERNGKQRSSPLAPAAS